MQETVGITFIIVTHDQDEALSMASRIAVMDKGAVQQIATPSELYEHPASRFVADFIGKVNLIDAKVLSTQGQDHHLRGQGPWQGGASDTDKACGGNVAIAVRPEKLKISQDRAKGRRPHQGRRARCATSPIMATPAMSSSRSRAGLTCQVNVQNDSRTGGAGVERGQTVWVHWLPDDSLVLTE